jgi:hypothetical protein
MRSQIHDEAVELLLASISKRRNDGLMSSFFFGKPGAPHWDRRMGVEIYYRPNKLIRAALFVRQNGPGYLRFLSIDDIRSMLQNFVVENYWYLRDTFLKQFDGSYAANVSPAVKAELAEALALSEIFQPRNELTLFPIATVNVKGGFNSEPFFLIKPADLREAPFLPTGVGPDDIQADQFPPLLDFKGRRERPSAWLGVRSPVVQASKKMKSAILGAIALTPLPAYRFMFTGRKVFGGLSTITEGGISVAFGEPHTPPLSDDIVIDVVDHAWLAILASKLGAVERSVRRQLSALEYFYRAWELDPSERFPILCMALDAIFGDVSHATQAVIESVRSVLGPQIEEQRLRQLMELRASVIHGGAPDVYDSRKYARYYDEYEADPIHDLELVVANCLRRSIFGEAMNEQADPNAAIVAEAQAKGRLPKDLTRSTILNSGIAKLAGDAPDTAA